jgi:hypothetical protein
MQFTFLNMVVDPWYLICKKQCYGSGMFIPDRGSDFFPSRIPDPNCLHPDPGYASKNLSILTPRKWFLNSRKYDPGCSSRIRILTFYPSRIPDPGVKKAPDPGFATLVRTASAFLLLSHWIRILIRKGAQVCLVSKPVNSAKFL